VRGHPRGRRPLPGEAQAALHRPLSLAERATQWGEKHAATGRLQGYRILQ
jgi:hypothetical protein